MFMMMMMIIIMMIMIMMIGINYFKSIIWYKYMVINFINLLIFLCYRMFLLILKY